MATTTNRGQCIKKTQLYWEDIQEANILLPEATRKYVQILQIYSNVIVLQSQ